MVACLFTLNAILMAFALALILGPVLLRLPWDARPLRPFLLAPFILVCCGLLLGGINIFAAQGATMSVFFFHF
jgi:hypothetical protein